MCTIGEMNNLKVPKEQWGYSRETTIAFESGSPNFRFGMFTASHVQKVAPGPDIGGDHYRSFGFVR